MEVSRIEVDREKALKLFKEYEKHKHYSTPIDQEIMKLYELISQGKVVIQALASIAKAGVGDDGFPKLAIARADEKKIQCSVWTDGSCEMAPPGGVRARARFFSWPRETFATKKDRAWRSTAIVPPAPLHMRPRYKLSNYHTLWEAEWGDIVPHDPMLLRRIGKGDTWLVLAHWDLTEVERAVLTSRLGQ